MTARNRTHKEYLEAKKAEEEEDEEEEDEDLAVLNGGEEEGEEGEGEGEGEGEEEEEEVDPDAFDPIPRVKTADPESKYFVHGENVRNKFNEVELSAFMKLLNIKPVSEWQDTTVHHYKMGVHEYEDEAQELDPQYHILSETERLH